MNHRPTRRSFLLLTGAVAASAVAACSGKKVATPQPSSSLSTASSTSAVPTPTAPSTTATPTSPVHVSLRNDDGQVYGVGMPIMALFNVAPTDAKAFNAATKVLVGGQPVVGNWYFEPTATPGAVLEAHWRPETYWPGHASVHMDLPVQGLSAGAGLSYDDSLTLDFTTGDANIGTIDASTLQLSLETNGVVVGTYPVSLGAPDTPTATGTKVIMEKGLDIRMTGPGYDDPHVKFTQRLTYGGEYLHSAPWNIANIGHRSTSNGCTNLLPVDAQALYSKLRIGDVFIYPNADGPPMTLGAGYGDWNVDWSTWQTGGALPL